MNTTPSTHHPFGPSSIDRIIACPLSYRASKGLPDVSNEYAKEGTRLHDEIARIILEYVDGQSCFDYISLFSDLKSGKLDDYPQTIQTALWQLRKLFVSNGVFAENEETAKPLKNVTKVEQILKINTRANDVLIAQGLGEVFGTTDLYVVFEDKNEAFVVDWKFGYNKPLDACDSMQTACYAMGVQEKYNNLDVITVCIINPNFSFNESNFYTFNNSELMIANEIMSDSIILALDENQDLAPCISEEHCRYCKANTNGKCSAISNTVSALSEYTKNTDVAIKDKISEIDFANLIELKEKCDLVQTLAKAVDDELKARCLASEDKTYGDWIVKEQSGGKEITDIQKAYGAINDVVSMDEYLSACTLSVSKLKDIYATKLKESGAVKTKKAGTEAYDDAISQYLCEKSPRLVLSKVKAPSTKKLN